MEFAWKYGARETHVLYIDTRRGVTTAEITAENQISKVIFKNKHRKSQISSFSRPRGAGPAEVQILKRNNRTVYIVKSFCKRCIYFSPFYVFLHTERKQL